MKSQNIYYQLTIALARAMQADRMGSDDEESIHLNFIKAEVEDMLARLVLRGAFDVAGVISPVADRPEGWLTVLEWLAENELELLMSHDDLAVETSRLGIKCSRLLRAAGESPWSVPAPKVFADEADHFVTVYTYPPEIIKTVVTTMR